jgi:hypothetical protein
MKSKSMFLVLILSVMFLTALPSTALAKPLGWWAYVEHERDIVKGEVYSEGHYNEYALSGYGQLISSTGRVGFDYEWNDVTNTLWNHITNYENYTVHVVWRCWFYYN